MLNGLLVQLIKMASIKKSDVLVHLATDGGYEKVPKI